MSKLLIVDDEPDIVNMIERYAKRDGYETKSASDGGQAIDICEKEEFDLIIMDVMMPDTDGFSAVKKIREFSQVPVIMLSARGTEYDKLFGFEVGVTDYVTKPFSPLELMARVKAQIRQAGSFKKKEDMPQIIKISGLEIDTLGMTVTVDGMKTDLTQKEFSILLLLLKNPNVVLSRDRMLNEVWGYDTFGVDRTVDWQIKLLRSKMGPYRDYIKTIRGVGYKFEEN